MFEAYHTFVEGRTHRYFVEAPDILTYYIRKPKKLHVTMVQMGTDNHNSGAWS